MIRFGWLLMLLSLGIPSFAARLQSVTYEHQGDRTSIILTVQGFLSHKVFLLKAPERVVVDFNQTELAASLNQSSALKAGILRVRSGVSNGHTLRIVFEVKRPMTLRTSPWHAPGYQQQGIRIDLYANASKPVVSLGTHAPHVLPKEAQPYRARQPVAIVTRPMATMPPPRGRRNVVVVLDAGHGGKDPGASGPRKTKEKYITLAIAQKLKQLIDRQPGMRAVLTRGGDYYVGLRERLNIARRQNADIFVSIHADAFKNRESNGASVFALSPTGATSEAASWLAEKENHSELGGVNLAGLDDQNGLVRTVLLDLSQTATISASLKMGQRVLQNLNTMTRLHNVRVEQARFVVLKSPDIPSVLIETGFISNPREESNLTSSSYQARLTQSIFQGLKSYFIEYPPHGSRLEAMSSNLTHIVRRGESLPQIAARYHVSINTIMKANRMRSTALLTNQSLVIPIGLS